MSSSEGKKIIRLKSSDDQPFEVEEKTVALSLTLKHMIEDLDSCDDSGGDGGCLTIPLQNVAGDALAKVLEYCKFHAGDPEAGEDAADSATEEKRKAWNKEFIGQLDIAEVLDLLNASNYMNIADLQELASQTAADMIKDKTVEEVRELFNIENDYTEEEEKKLRTENAWAFEI